MLFPQSVHNIKHLDQVIDLGYQGIAAAAASGALGAVASHAVKGVKSYLGKRSRVSAQVNRVITNPRKMPRIGAFGSQLSTQMDFDYDTVRGGGKGVLSHGIWEGKFRGRRRRDNMKMYSGFSEHRVSSGDSYMTHCSYTGICSYPSGSDLNTGCSMALQDIMTAVLRRYFEKYYTYRFEVSDPDEPLMNHMYVYGNSFTTGAMVANLSNGPSFVLLYSQNDGTGEAFGAYTSLSSNATLSLRGLAAIMAAEIETKWKAGLEPRSILGVLNYKSSDQFPVGSMSLVNLRIHYRSTVTMSVQNQTNADDTSASMTDIQSNPLHGKIMYFKGVAPVQATGQFMWDLASKAGTEANEWAAHNLTGPTTSYGTVYSFGVSGIPVTPTGVWAAVPKDNWFKNCTGSMLVSMEPGVQKKFALKFKFDGRLTDWLRKEYTNVGSAAINSTYKIGMGSCALLVVEKRIRRGGVPVTIAWQSDMYTTVKCSAKKQGMLPKVTVVNA